MLEINLSDDRKTATIDGADDLDTNTILTALVAANALDLIQQCQTKSALRRYYGAARASEPFKMSELAVGEKFKSLRKQTRSREALWQFVEAGMKKRVVAIPIPEGRTSEETVRRHEKKEVALAAARLNGGIPVLMSDQQLEREMNDDNMQPFAREMAFTIVRDAIER